MKKSKKEIEKYLIENGYFLSEIISIDKKEYLIFYDKDGYLYQKTFQALKNTLKSGRVRYFYVGNPYFKYNVSVFIKNNNLSYKVIENQSFNNSFDKIILEDRDGYRYSVVIESIVQLARGISKSLDKFNKSNSYTLYNLQLWINKNNRPFTLVENQEYKGYNKYLFFKCNNCPKEEIPFKATQNDIIMFGGCAICENRQVGKFNNLEYVYPDLAKEWDYDKNDLSAREVVYGSHKKVYWKCPECEFSYLADVYSRSPKNRGGTGCPNCSSSKLEREINFYLKKSGIKYERQYRFSDCRNINPLPFDFAVWSNRGLVLVEAQGLQHYKKEKRGWFSSDEVIYKIKRHDKIKEEYCKKNNIPLLIIPYWEFDNIEKILEENLFP